MKLTNKNDIVIHSIIREKQTVDGLKVRFTPATSKREARWVEQKQVMNKYIAHVKGEYKGLPFEFTTDSMQPITDNDIYRTMDMFGIGRDGRPYLKVRTHKPENYLIMDLEGF